MSTATLPAYSLGRKIYHHTYRLGKAIALIIMLWGCTAPGFNASNVVWKTYTNNRYRFEFPYPSNWNALPPPDNGDGIAFVSPQKNSVIIRSWAGNRLPEAVSPEAKVTVNPNFKTAQGIPGVMVVEVGQQGSSMTLTITQGQVKYYWQGRSDSQDFTDYYRLFYYIAQQYKVL
ncbi:MULTISPECIES: hypothetical protein [Calothrix]|uniref:Uncharacterized protein n=2 Tax=Calothrix TaxID=1186 RepID=A0ABR8A4Y3_9CYAN|nr:MULTISPECIES: hypothetical protein [Calothrix]MBD2194460.1 hypothetical protein [Calothrix parietina FACHB-288]MBD2229648.1 hypothetical protein [Calothrix anomala FACHB-343]